MFPITPTWKSELNFPAFLAVENMQVTQALPMREVYIHETLTWNGLTGKTS